ncbi:MAG TPA: fatty acid desaturase [Casimicrobiaceae bacterium]|nr:fatty acid desaturase [Casimicrobiaceae bacterium]
MLNDVLSLLARGLSPLPWWGYVVVALVFTHITIAAVTIYLHRSQSHRALDLHPAVAHVFRFWLWLTTGMVTKEWVAIHRKHHAKVETADDPHSPVAHGIDKVFWQGSELYRAEAKNADTLAKYGHGTPDDWLERNLYSRFSWQGVGVMMVIDLVLFGSVGLTIWAVQMLWIPVTAAGIINGIGHYWGYRSYACADASTNIVPWGILIGGEELHNNHHAYATSAKLSSKWYEFDIGWAYIRILAALGLADVRKVAPKLKKAPAKSAPDLATLQAIITHRYHVATAYARTLKAACATELAALRARNAKAKLPSAGRIKRFLTTGPSGWSPTDLEHVESTVAQSHVLAKIVAMRAELSALWERSTESSEQLLAKLQDWCHRAEDSGIPPLVQFAHKLRRYA